jgi:hypothetical protein
VFSVEESSDREQFWTEIREHPIPADLNVVRALVNAPHLGFYPKRWQGREVPVPQALLDRLKQHEGTNREAARRFLSTFDT